MTSLTMLDRFQGCLLGGLVRESHILLHFLLKLSFQVGDCLGAEFEFRRGQSVLPRQQVAAHVAAVKAGKRAGVVGPGSLVQVGWILETEIKLSYLFMCRKNILMTQQWHARSLSASWSRRSLTLPALLAGSQRSTLTNRVVDMALL